MWHLMIFSDVARSNLVKVMTLQTARDVGYVMDLPTVTIYNFFHEQIIPRGVLRYVSLFRDVGRVCSH